METYCWRRIERLLLCLNRTMQYGNRLFQISGGIGVASLNRTMQYGNFSAQEERNRGSSSLNRTMQYGNHPRPTVFLSSYLFKSYYVVWKLQHLWFSLRQNTGLNRTMQYGNSSAFFLSSACFLSLNRTMQYGNLVSHRGMTRRFPSFKSYYVVWKQKQFNYLELPFDLV